MTPVATQLPFVRDSAKRTGRKLFRKQILPRATVEHPEHGPLHFTTDRLAKLREAFLAGAMDQVPFSLVDGDNRHNDDPLRFMGEIKGVELADDGLYATVETTEGGTKLLSDNPNLPVSVRIKTLPDGREVLAHVAGTHDPVVVGMKPWQDIDASQNVQVCDFSRGGCYKTLSMAEPQTPPAGQTPPSVELSTEEEGKFRSFLQRLGVIGSTPTEPASPAPAASEPVTELTDADLEQMLAAADVSTEEPATASLSDEDRQKIDLANQRAERAEVRAGKAIIKARLDGYVNAGVPPAVVDPIRAQLIGDGDEQKALAIDFANEREPAAAKALFAALDAAKGTIDFSERGSHEGADSEAEARKAKLDAWEKSSG